MPRISTAGGNLAQTADLLRAIASLMWVGIGVAVLVLLGRVIIPRAGQLSSLAFGPSGLSMQFVEAKVSEAVQSHDDSNELVGLAAQRTVVDRLQRHAELISRARILWVDDHPENNSAVIELLRKYGAVVETPRSNAQAMALRASTVYDVIISDVARDDEGPDSDMKGVEFARAVYERWQQQILLFSGKFNPATVPNWSVEDRLRLVVDLQRGVFGHTNRVDVALHLIMDMLER
jgi:CheY-like chemotaxis protein